MQSQRPTHAQGVLDIQDYLKVNPVQRCFVGPPDCISSSLWCMQVDLILKLLTAAEWKKHVAAKQAQLPKSIVIKRSFRCWLPSTVNGLWWAGTYMERSLK